MDSNIPQNLAQNKKIRDAAAAYQADPSQENLFLLLTQIAQRAMKEGMFMAPVNPERGSEKLYMTVRTEDGKEWFVAYTDISEAEKDETTSIVNTPIAHYIQSILDNGSTAGLLINPWTQALPLSMPLLKVIARTVAEADSSNLK